MKASLTLNKEALDRLIEKFDDPTIKQELDKIPQRRAVAAMVGQAIADNFIQEGPGWTPLKPDTIRGSVSKKKYQEIKNLPDKELAPHRSLLRRTGLLMNSASVPGSKGNIWKTEGHNLIWGTDLVYAAIHNNGGVIRPKNAKVLHWKSNTGDHFASQVTIPQRKFMIIRDQWMRQINDYILTEAMKIIKDRIMK